MATKKPSKKPTTGRLTEIVAFRRSQGGSVTGALAGGIKERLKEKFDPRQLINQKGLLTALFPGLKTYQSKTAASEISKSSIQAASFDEVKPILEVIAINTKMTAKNTMVLPALHRDVNVMRQNMVKLVKLKGGDARTKADMFFVKSKEREDKYERELKKESLKKSKLEKIQQQKEEKDKDESKSIFQKLISSIVKGLSSIVGALANLGKAILGVFKFLANVIGNIITTIIKSIMNGLLGINLTNKISELFKSLISKNWIKFLYGIIARGIFGFIFSVTGLKSLAGRLALYLIPIMLGKSALQAFLERRMQEGEISAEDERKAFRDEEGMQQIPVSSIFGKNLDEYRDLGLVDKNTVALGGTPGRGVQLDETLASGLKNALDKNILFEYQEGKRQAYRLKIPGISGSSLLFLTEKEATEWGDNRRKYLAIIDRLIKIKEGKVELSEDQLGNLYDAYSSTRNNLLDLYEKHVKDQFKNIPKATLNNIEVARNRKKEDFSTLMGRNLYENYIEPAFDAVYPKEEPKFVQEMRNQADEVFSGFKGIMNLPDNIRNSLSGVPEEIKNYLSTAQKELNALNIMDRTADNRRNSVVFKQPIVINQESVAKRSNPQLGSPASAWNNDFIDKHFSDMISNPFKNL